MNDIPSPRVLLIAAKRPKQFDDHILPKMRDFGITVVRTVEPTFRGSLEDIDAVFVMFEFCGRETYAALRRQCEIAKVKFIILPQQASAWLRIFAENGLRVPGKPVEATPLPLPPPTVVYAKVEACEAQEPEEAEPADGASDDEPETAGAPFLAYGETVASGREKAGLSQVEFAELIGISRGHLRQIEGGNRAPSRDLHIKIVGMLPDVAKVTVAFAARPRGRAVAAQHAALTSRAAATPLAPVQVPPVLALPVKANGHSHHRPPLEALLRAARAVGIGGNITVTVNEQGTTVRVGEEVFSGAFDDAVEKARGVLVGRLREQRRLADERLAELGAA